MNKFNLTDKEGNPKEVPKLNLNYGGRGNTMKMQILNWLTNYKIEYELGQVKGGFESIKIPYKQRADFIEYLRKHRVKVHDINYSDNMDYVSLIFEKESRL